MSDKVTVESLRAEALAWHATAERLRLVLVKIHGYAQPEFGMDDGEVRAVIAQVAGRELEEFTTGKKNYHHGDTENTEKNFREEREEEDLTPAPSLKGRDEEAVERFYSDVEG